MLPFLKSFFTNPKAEMEEIKFEDSPEPQQASPLLMLDFQTFMLKVKMATLSTGQEDLSGFQFIFNGVLSPNFLIRQEISLKQETRQMLMQRQQFGIPPPAFYTLNLQFHDLSQDKKRVNYSLIGKVDSNLNVDAIFHKQWGNWGLKLHGFFKDSSLRGNRNILTLNYQEKQAKHVIQYQGGQVEYQYLQNLSNRLLAGIAGNYSIDSDKLTLQALTKYSLNNDKAIYAQWSETNNILQLGAHSQIDKFTSLSTSMDLLMTQMMPMASLGYRKSVDQYDVKTAVRTDGDLQTFFGVKQKFF